MTNHHIVNFLLIPLGSP